MTNTTTTARSSLSQFEIFEGGKGWDDSQYEGLEALEAKLGVLMLVDLPHAEHVDIVRDLIELAMIRRGLKVERAVVIGSCLNVYVR